VVLDGKQRLLSLLQFWGLGEGPNNAYRLSGLEVRTNLCGRGFPSSLRHNPPNGPRGAQLPPRNEKGSQLRADRLSHSAPPGQQKANACAPIPALIEGVIPLQPLLLLRSKNSLGGCYTSEHLSVREIARLADVGRSTVPEALDRYGTPGNGNRHNEPIILEPRDEGEVQVIAEMLRVL